MTTRARALAVVLTAGLLAMVAGCGGGGGDAGGTPPPLGGRLLSIGPDNYVAAAQEALGSAAFVGDTSRLAIAAQVADDSVLMASALAQLRRWPARLAAVPRLASGVVLTETEACPGGGRMTLTFDDRNGNGDVDAGDSLATVFENCVAEGVRLGGRLAMRMDALSGNFDGLVYSATLTMTLDNFSASVGGVDTAGSGEMRITDTSRALNDSTTTLAIASLTSSANLGGTTVTRRLTDFSYSIERRPAGNSYTETSTFGGTIVSTRLSEREINVSTPVPLVRPAAAPYPISGQVLAAGSNGSRVRVTAQNSAQVLIELDADGNGSYETSTTRPWSEMR